MSKTLVIVGAGPGLGMGVARAFGAEGFRVGLIARNPATLAELTAQLQARGVTARAFPADILDRASLADALTAAKDALGEIDVLEYSPSPTGSITSAAETTVESAAAQFALHVLGAITAVGRVLPDMLAKGAGTVLLTTGISASEPVPILANVGLAMAGLRNWAHTLHEELAPHGVHVATVTIGTRIAAGAGDGDPDAIGARYLDLHRHADRVEEVVGDLDEFRARLAAHLATQGPPVAADPR
ncbi:MULTISPECIES: SDR family NAD(P)-dependent oxidoreductase [Actinoalloteichus]|uniref:Short chain dehydrogenase n=1 Tax=Actinoalloteichus fjordicus TaxID=1612552 RepID=A0AAC9LCF9_9PSEU|nr:MULTISPECIES: SDR family NAD(P)-dependent oxidoreductase [Actinoalloteichus]APU14310.1 short chain dehydrogenase [Actinoalloteichus fjordicus]APU20279.1 short chain dehydrogenase [Actinoalloteichus sp. GBA129-24]